MPVDGAARDTRWVLSGGGRWYMLGKFDGRRFTPETPRLPMTHGPDCYATQTWSDAPGGRRVGIAWLDCWSYESGPRAGRIENKLPTESWAGGCLTVPFEMTLRTTPEGGGGVRLFQVPVPELAGAGGRAVVWRDREITSDVTGRMPIPLPALAQAALDLELEFAATDPALALEIPSAGGGLFVLTLDAPRRQLVFDRSQAGFAAIPQFAKRYEAPLPVDASGKVAVRLILDRCSIEIFAGGGLVHFSALLWPDESAATQLRAVRAGVTCRVCAAVYAGDAVTEACSAGPLPH
jgi:sucrose-6-phosphate hydrolase SacC (GH32 family)